MKLTIEDIERYQERMVEVKRNGFMAGEFKALGREIQSEFPQLTVPQITSILNNNASEILNILKSQ